MQAFAGFTLVVVLLMGVLAAAFVYAVEDEFFSASLQTEVDRQQRHKADHGAFTTPALPSMQLYPPGSALPADIAGQVASHPGRAEFEGADGRHYHLRRVDADGTRLVAEVSDQLVVRRMRPELLYWMLAAAGGLALLGMGMGAWWSRRISAPLTKLADRVARIAPNALPQGLSQSLAHDEVGQLARHLDLLHSRTRDFIEREQAFTADVSHELRTPLAVLGAAADRLQQQACVEQQPLARSIQLAVWHLGRTIDTMLALARESSAEADSSLARPLLPMLERLVLAHAPLLDRERAEVSLLVPATVTRPWSPTVTHLLVSNLLGNALAHATLPQVVIEADEYELRVCNPSLSPPATVMDDAGAGGSRGIRGPASSGLGLGLSIARRLAETHGLAVELRYRQGWTQAIVRPAAGPETKTSCT
jgi:signal transduction histidine kinase